jgi:tRNA pseudouridine55 synthase
MNPGIYLVHKPVGMTSFQIVRTFVAEAREAGMGKLAIGHGGTLDPFAEGLLLLLVGQATRLMELMHPLPKTYLAEVAWGSETDTCDPQGLEVASGDPSILEPGMLEVALTPFLGWIGQIPPATSAKKIGGEAAYRKAHRGEEVVLPPCRVYLHSARWVRHHLPGSSTLELTCRGGFYVRSLARDLGQALGCRAHLTRLHRTAIGPWEDPGAGLREHLAGEALLPWCRSRHLDEVELDHLLHGRPIPTGSIVPPLWLLPEGFPDPGAPVQALHEGRLVALLKEKDGAWWTLANLRGGL